MSPSPITSQSFYKPLPTTPSSPSSQTEPLRLSAAQAAEGLHKVFINQKVVLDLPANGWRVTSASRAMGPSTHETLTADNSLMERISFEGVGLLFSIGDVLDVMLENALGETLHFQFKVLPNE